MKDLDRRLRSQLVRFTKNDAEYQERHQSDGGNPWWGNLLVLGMIAFSITWGIFVVWDIASLLSSLFKR